MRVVPLSVPQPLGVMAAFRGAVTAIRFRALIEDDTALDTWRTAVKILVGSFRSDVLTVVGGEVVPCEYVAGASGELALCAHLQRTFCAGLSDLLYPFRIGRVWESRGIPCGGR